MPELNTKLAEAASNLQDFIHDINLASAIIENRELWIWEEQESLAKILRDHEKTVQTGCDCSDCQRAILSGAEYEALQKMLEAYDSVAVKFQHLEELNAAYYEVDELFESVFKIESDSLSLVTRKQSETCQAAE